MPQPTLRWGATGPAVERLHEALAAAGRFHGAPHRRFSVQTYNALLALQAAHGLPLTGVADERTWAVLGGDSPSNGDAPAAARGRSIHVGVNRIDPAHYGTAGILHGCENDARAMETLARSCGFATQTLFSESATTTAVLGALAAAAQELRPGDILLLTYAGHGANVPNTDPEDVDREDDGLDETWCLFDRMLLDDELFAAMAAFARGVRIVVLSDSCHSGTISRELRVDRAVAEEHYYAVLDGAGRTRNLNRVIADKVANDHPDVYRPLRAPVHATVRASAITLSGCQDNQLSQEKNGRGVFSTTLERVWAGGTFEGGYRELQKAIVALMPPHQTPNITIDGEPDAGFEAERPFTIAPSPVKEPLRALAAGG